MSDYRDNDKVISQTKPKDKEAEKIHSVIELNKFENQEQQAQILQKEPFGIPSSSNK